MGGWMCPKCAGGHLTHRDCTCNDHSITPALQKLGREGMEKSVTVGISDAEAGVQASGRVFSRERKEGSARVTLLPGSLWLKERTASLLCAVGADVMLRLTPVVPRLGRQYECARTGPKRLVASLKLKTAIRLYHLAFHLQKRIRQCQLRKLSIDQLLVQLRAEFGDLFDRHPVFGSIADKLPDLFAQIDAAADQADRAIGAADKAIKIHWKNPSSPRDSRKE